jgi:outer membrane protein with beta-barrel domain
MTRARVSPFASISLSALFFVSVSAPAAAQSKVPAQRRSSFAPVAPNRVLVGVNGGIQATSLSFKDTRVDDPFFGERATWTADYKVQNAPAFDVGGGVRVWRKLHLGVAFSRFEDKRAADVAGEIPHPFIFNQPRAISGESRSLKHAEQAIHVGAMWVVPATRRVQLAVFGGPSIFSIRRELIEDVEYQDTYPYDTATYESSIIRSVSESPFGFHVGADVAWFVTRSVGFGGGVRFARAQARLDSPASGNDVSVDVGGLQAGVGLRLGFGR